FQTAGRGQAGNFWESEEGKNLLFSLLVYPDFLPANQQFLISQIVSLSVKKVLERYIKEVRVKWPNDIYWKEQKICGILIENDLMGEWMSRSVIGVGLNVNQEKFHSDAPNPVSLFQITGKKYKRDELLEDFLHVFFDYYTLLLQERIDEIRTAYVEALFHGDGYYGYTDRNGTFEAVVYSIEPTGHLILQLRTGELRRYAFKEVAFDVSGD
ncbi:MAG: biotin--[Parabacteroides sp.]|nr:biotin--[acetyl-CoA-carboxylase] ligase [Parabacteroides sp.]